MHQHTWNKIVYGNIISSRVSPQVLEEVGRGTSLALALKVRHVDELVRVEKASVRALKVVVFSNIGEIAQCLNLPYRDKKRTK